MSTPATQSGPQREASRPVPLIAASGVRIVLGGRPVVEGVDLELRPGEIVSLIGPNGSGKTTLVRALLGLQPAEGGIARRAGLRIGYVPQHLHIDRTLPLTVARFLRLVGGRDGADSAAALETAGAAALAGRPMQALSGGEGRRVLLAAALLAEPELLVLDEAAAGLDVAGQSEFYERIRQIRTERGCAVLLVSHDLHLVMAATDFVLCLNGHICCSGRPEAVSRNPAFLSLFGGRHAAELALYQHDLAHHQEHHSPEHHGREHAGGGEPGPHG